MKKTYYGTIFRGEIKNCLVFIDVFSKCRYTEAIMRSDILETLEYDRTVTQWDIVEGGEEAEAIEREEGIKDEYREYLVLHFTDGSTKTFPNSRVSMDIASA